MIQCFKFNKSHRTFMQKSVDQGPFDFFFFNFGTQNQFACLYIYFVASLNLLKIDKKSTIKQKSHYCKRRFYRSGRQEVFCKTGALKTS